jgi:hypothetical protein
VRSVPFLLSLFLPADTLALAGAQLSGGQKRALMFCLFRDLLKLIFSSIRSFQNASPSPAPSSASRRSCFSTSTFSPSLSTPFLTDLPPFAELPLRSTASPKKLFRRCVSCLRLFDMKLTLSLVPQALDKAAAGRTTIVRFYFVVPSEQTLTCLPSLLLRLTGHRSPSQQYPERRRNLRT